MTIKLNQPIKPNLEKLTQYLSQVNDSGWYTNFGPLHQQLTKRLEAYLGVKNLLLVSNGTLALQVAYKTLNVKNALTTPFSFVATTSSLIWQGIETSFSDIDKKTYNLCPEQALKALETDPTIDTIVATHVYANPCDVHAFEKLSKQKNINIIYDAAHAFGINIEDKSVLNFGDACTLSFHATKVFHTIEGGAIIFKTKANFERAKRLINFGIDEKGDLTEAGINAKLNEYQCAVGLTLLDDIEGVIKHRTALFHSYRNELKGVVELSTWHTESSFNGAYMPVYVADINIQGKLLNALADNNIESRRYFTPSLDLAYSQQKSFGCANSQKLAEGVICLPLHNSMSFRDVKEITNIVLNCVL